jgi:DNA-directed RNA polymerase subunit H (RpoH/RPB5)
MISIIKKLVADRGYVSSDSTIETEEKMGPYFKSDQTLMVFLARPFVESTPLGKRLSIPKAEVEAITAEYFYSMQDDLLESQAIVVVPTNSIDTSIFDEDIAPHGITVFDEKHLLFDPTVNILSSKHFVASEDELEDMATKGIEYDKLPSISVHDRMCKWYGFRRGDIVRIEREYCNEVYYRVVV